MAKFCSTLVLDAALDFLAARATMIVGLSGAPANLAACTAATYIIRATLTTGASTSFTKGDGATAGSRKVTIGAKATLSPNATGVISYLALYGTAAGNSGLWYYTSCTPSTVQSTSDRVSIPTWAITFSDAT
jgi:hypothetical protein